MFVDVDDLPKERPIDVDVCLVGGGAAGIAIAAELARSDLRVVVIEGGGLEPSSEGGFAPGAFGGKPITLRSDPTKPWFLGGSTHYWYGNCRPLDDDDFRERAWIAHSGWPIGRAELLPFYERAQRVCGLGEFKWYDPDASRSLLTHPPLERGQPVLSTRILQTCSVLSFLDLHGGDLGSSENVRVVLGAHALRLVTGTSGARAEALEVTDRDGGRFRIEADKFVLACGGVETTRLLLNSKRSDGTGLGNDSDLLGRFFMEHIFFDLGLGSWTSPDLKLYELHAVREEQYEHLQQVGDARVWAQLALSTEFMEQEQVPGMSLWFVDTLPDTPSVAAMRSLAKGLLRRQRLERPLTDARLVLTDPLAVPRHLSAKLRERGRFDRSGYSLRVQFEQTPDADNRIRLSESLDRFGQPTAQLDLTLAVTESRLQLRSLEAAADAIELPGRRLSRQLALLVDAGQYGFFWHHMGATRMSDDPAQGVVDGDCRVHGVQNVFVSGCSVFPTSGTAAPTLTVVALALRLADRLRLGVGQPRSIPADASRT